MRMRPSWTWKTTSVDKPPLADEECVAKCQENPHLLVPWFISSAYAYDKLDNPFLSDACFDWVCKELTAKWHTIVHWHKEFIRPPTEDSPIKSSLDALYTPLIAREMALRILERYNLI